MFDKHEIELDMSGEGIEMDDHEILELGFCVAYVFYGKTFLFIPLLSRTFRSHLPCASVL
jgi:hypothetical protein